jgi:argininosuccinate lyase
MFDSLGKVKDSLQLIHLMLETADWKLEAMANAVFGDFSTATDLADFLAATGMPFRQAHEVVGKVVRGCLERNWVLEDLTEHSLKEIAPEVPVAALSVLSGAESVRRRESMGAPGPGAMEKQLTHAQWILSVEGFPKIA